MSSSSSREGPSRTHKVSVVSSDDTEGDRGTRSNIRHETSSSDHQKSGPPTKQTKRPQVPSSRSNVSDFSAEKSSQHKPTEQQIPQDQMHAVVAQLRPLQQQVDQSHSMGSGPSQQAAHIPPQQQQQQQQQFSAPVSANKFNGSMGGQNVQGRAAAAGESNDLISLAIGQQQQQQWHHDSITPVVSHQPLDDQQLQHQQSNANNSQMNNPIMALLTQILQQHHDQQRQDLIQQQQLEMQTLHQIQSSSDQQQHIMLLLHLFAGQQHQHLGSGDSSSQTTNTPSPQDVQGTLQEFVQSNLHSAGPSQTSTPTIPAQYSNAQPGNVQDASQLQLLQVLASQQPQEQQQLSLLRHTENREDSYAQEPSLLSNTPEALLQLMAQHLNNVQNNSAALMISTPHNGVASSTEGSSSVGGSWGSAGSNTMMPATISSMNQNLHSSQDAAQMQQYLLMNYSSATAEVPPRPAGMFSVEDLKYAFPDSAFDNRKPDGRATNLPALLVMQDDQSQLSAYQTLLRYQIEVFRATETDATTHQRGRNKPIRMNQIGVRCRHCSHLPISERARGSSYFPSGLAGVYQAGQNMNSTHFQQGVCTEMGEPLRRQFSALANIKSTSTGAGRSYWAKQAKILGLENDEEEGGIRFWRDDKSS